MNKNVSKKKTSKVLGDLVTSAVRPVWEGSIACVDRSEASSSSPSIWLRGAKDDLTSNIFQVSSFGDFDVYPEGVEMYKRRGAHGSSIGEDAFDRVRRTLEACDGVCFAHSQLSRVTAPNMKATSTHRYKGS